MGNNGEQSSARVSRNLGFQLGTRIIVLFLIMGLGWGFSGWQSTGIAATGIVIVICLVFFSVTHSLWCFKWGSKDGAVVRLEPRFAQSTPSSGSVPVRLYKDLLRMLTPKGNGFPLPGLIWDLFSLAFLITVTGGIASIFLPLFVIGLLVGDVALEDESARNRLRRAFIGISFLAVVASYFDSPRCLILTGKALATLEPLISGELSCPASTWNLPGYAQATFGLGIFLASAVFGSYVLRGFIKSTRSQPKAT